jgi:hypothetical protein
MISCCGKVGIMYGGMRVGWDEAINAYYGCHWHNKQGKCVGTAGTTIVTQDLGLCEFPSAGSSTRDSGMGP